MDYINAFWVGGLICALVQILMYQKAMYRHSDLIIATTPLEKAYLLAAAAEDAPETFAGTEKAVQGWVDCFPRCALAGTVFAGGVNGVGEIAGHPALEQAYQMGKEV